jgi:hypothetical protein
LLVRAADPDAGAAFEIQLDLVLDGIARPPDA